MGQEEPVTTAIGSFITNERDWEQRAQESLITRGANVARFSLTVALAGASLVVALPELLDKDRGAWPFWSLSCAVATLIAAGVLGLRVGRVVRLRKVRVEWLQWQAKHGDGTVSLDPDLRHLSSLRATNNRNEQYLQWAMHLMWVGTSLAVANLLVAAYQPG